MKTILLDSSVNIKDLSPQVLKQLDLMSEEYYKLTKKFIKINKGWSMKSYPNSSHNYGNAFDTDTPIAEELEKLGLMEKYGFHRPLIKFIDKETGKPETWHIEPYPGIIYGPRNTNNVPWRKLNLQKKKV